MCVLLVSASQEKSTSTTPSLFDDFLKIMEERPCSFDSHADDGGMPVADHALVIFALIYDILLRGLVWFKSQADRSRAIIWPTRRFQLEVLPVV